MPGTGHASAGYGYKTCQVSLLGSIGRALIIVGETPLEFYGPYYL